LSLLSEKLVSRNLFKIKSSKTEFSSTDKDDLLKKVMLLHRLTEEEADYFLIDTKIDNRAYNTAANSIQIRFKDGSIKDVASASDHLNLHALSQTVEKHFLCFPID